MKTTLHTYRGYLILTLIFTAILGAVLLWRLPAPAPIVITEPTPLPTATPVMIQVYVSGAVAHPEVYSLPENGRVKDALIAAGGLLPEAAAEQINLAAILRDGQELHVATRDEVATVPTVSAPGAVASPLNINTASAQELEQLPGIGAVLAQRIWQDRQINGPYETVEDLTRVKGVGPALLQKLAGQIVCR